jgi:hopene-associated glycosyltransferase HpnB
MIAETIGVLSLAIWVYLLAVRGGFWRVSTQVLLPAAQSSDGARVAVIIPARDEAEVIAQSIRSLLAQDYCGAVHIFVVDDHSSDQTTPVALQAAAEAGKADTVTVIPSAPLVSGWTGKLWAVAQGVQHAKSFNPDFLWLTDADVVHGPNMLSSLVAKASSGKFDLVSVMVKLRCVTWAERAFVPAFVFFFFKLYPPSWVASSRRRTAAAAGGCILIRANTLSRIGGIESFRDQMIDDCALARRVKSVGQIWMGLSPNSRSIRWYATSSDVGQMVARNAFTQLRHSAALLLATALGMAITYLVPPLLAFWAGWTSALGLITWTLMMISFYPMLKFYGRSPLWAPFLPAIAAFYLGATVYSAFQYWTGRGGEWKGRVQDPIATIE